MPATELIEEALKEVYDPEIGVNIVDLGLVYGIDQSDGTVEITMTLTTPMCPLGPVLESEVKEALNVFDDVKDVKINLVWIPPWSPDKMSEDAKLELGFW